MPSRKLTVVGGTAAGDPRQRWWTWKGIAWTGFWVIILLALTFDPWTVLIVGFGVAWAVNWHQERKRLNALPIVGRVVVDRRWWR